MTDTADETRFHELAWPHLDAVLRTAQCLTHSTADAEDLAQETMLKAFKAIRTVRDTLLVKAWLMTILRRARIDQARSTNSEASLDQLEIDPACHDAVGDLSLSGVRRDPQDVLSSMSDEKVIHALRELPQGIRWALLLVDVEGMDQREAGAVLGVPVGTVKSRLHRGRAMLRTVLQPAIRIHSSLPELDCIECHQPTEQVFVTAS